MNFIQIFYGLAFENFYVFMEISLKHGYKIKYLKRKLDLILNLFQHGVPTTPVNVKAIRRTKLAVQWCYVRFKELPFFIKGPIKIQKKPRKTRRELKKWTPTS